MSAAVYVADGKLSVNLIDLVESLDDATKHEVAKACAFDEELIRMVVGLVVEGWAFDEEDGGWSLGTQTLTRIREQLLPLMDEVTTKLVGQLIRERDGEHLEHARWRNAYWNLWHHHNDTRESVCGDEVPAPPAFVSPAWPTTEGTLRVLEEAREKWGAS